MKKVKAKKIKVKGNRTVRSKTAFAKGQAEQKKRLGNKRREKPKTSAHHPGRNSLKAVHSHQDGRLPHHDPASNPYLPRPYKVIGFHRETSDNFSITINMKIFHDPGQFVQVSIPGIGESPISICSDSREYVKLNVREVGNVTRALASIREGDTLLVRGPYGRGYPMRYLKGNNLLLIGGGCGVAPLKGIIDYVENHRSDYRDIQLFLGYRSPDDILFKKEIEEWRQRYRLTVTVDQIKGGLCFDAKEGFVTNAIRDACLSSQNSVAFVCGPPVMMKAVISILLENGFHDDQIFISAERLMYCALGVCCHCMIRSKFTCLDGPVFRYDEIKEYTND